MTLSPFCTSAYDKKKYDVGIIKGNNLRHQYGDMHIAATVTYVRICDKIMKSA